MGQGNCWVGSVPEQGPGMQPKSKVSNQPFNPLLWPQGSLPVPWVVKAQKQQKDPQNPVSAAGRSQLSPSLQLPQFGCPRLPFQPHPRQHQPCSCSCPGNGAALSTNPAFSSAWEGLFPRALQVPGSRGSPALTLPDWEQLQTAQSRPFPILPGWETGFNSFLWSGMCFPSSVSHLLPWTWRPAPKFGSSGTLGALGCFGSPREVPQGNRKHLWSERAPLE